MTPEMKLTEEISVGGQPGDEDLKQLAAHGFRSVINLRREGEEDQPLSPAEEESRARQAGLEYRHIPVSSDNLDAAKVDRFREELRQLPTPVFVHCAGGTRAGAFSMMDLAIRKGWSGEECLRRAEEMGFKCDKPELKEFVRQYIDSHSA